MKKKVTFTGSITPLVLFKIDGLSDRDFKVMAYMIQLETFLSSAESGGRFFHKSAEIAEEIGMSKPTVDRALENLYDLGLIGKKRQGKTLSNIYWINREYLKELENEAGTSYKGTKRVTPKKEAFTLIAEQKPFRAPKTVEASNPTPATIEGQECGKECDTRVMPVALSRRVKTELQRYLKNVPQPILNMVMDSMYEGKQTNVSKDKWKRDMLPSLNIKGIEGKIWLDQLWNNF